MNNLIVSWEVIVEHRIVALTAGSKSEELRQLASTMTSAARDCWILWAQSLGGNTVYNLVDKGAVEVPLSAIAQLGVQVEKYKDAIGQPLAAVGVGPDLLKSHKALQLSLQQGRSPILYTKEIEGQLEENREPLKKTAPIAPVAPTPSRVEGSEHSDAEAAAAQANDTKEMPNAPEMTHAADELSSAAAQAGAPVAGIPATDPKQMLSTALEQIQRQSPALAQLRATAPKLYSAVQGLVDATIAWARSTQLQKSDDLKKAISDIPVGPRTNEIPGNWGGSGRMFDYSHVLSPEHQAQGYTMRVHQMSGSMVGVTLHHGSNKIGSIVLEHDPQPRSLSTGTSRLNEEYRGKGLGMAMYEAVMAHAKNALGVETMTGGIHSTMASKTHERLSAKHGMDYQAKVRHYSHDDRPGPDDGRMSPYSYTIKGDMPLSKKQLDPSLGYKSDDLKKAISDIPVGDRSASLSDVPSPHQERVFDYSHVLSPEHRAQGYAMRVHRVGSALSVLLHYQPSPDGPPVKVGSIDFDHDPDSASLETSDASLDELHQSKGLGMAMYEAGMAHAKNALGVKTMTGGIHSTPASRTHARLAAKHGMDYQPKVRPNSRDDRPGPYDGRMSPYSYTIKGEMPLSKKQLDPSLGYKFSTVHGTTGGLPSTTINAHTADGEHVGYATFHHKDGGLVPFGVGVDDDHQRRGLASHMYGLAQNATGKTVTPSPVQTPEGAALWQGNAAQKQFGQPMAKAELDVMDGVSVEEASELARKLSVDLSQISLEAFRQGVAHEREHAGVTGGDAEVTARIALDHLTEDPDYYTKLSTIEKGELPMPDAPTRHVLQLPAGSKHEGGPGAARQNVGKIKVQHGDGSTSWIQARAGMISATTDRQARPILGHASHPLSSRNPTGH